MRPLLLLVAMGSLLLAESPAREETRVELIAHDAAQADALLDALGARIESRSHDRIQAVVPEQALPAIEASRGIVEVARPGLFVPLQSGAPASIIGAEEWHTAGFTGYGTSVAILDSGFQGYEAMLGVSLPSGVTAESFRADGDLGAATDHGLRAAELVHDIAPGASLHLVNFSTVTELSRAVDYLIDQRVDVISFSLGYIHNGPGNGTGPVNEIVTRATNAGIAWSVAAGNWAQQHWSGPYRDTDGDAFHEFTFGAEINEHHFVAGDLITVSLRWDERWGAACSDFDLEVFGPSGALVRAARGIQNCTQDPVESLQVLATQTGDYGVRIINARLQAPRMLDLMVVGSPDRGSSLADTTAAGSLSEPADHPDVVTAGALTVSAPRGESYYSSRGPTTDGRAKPEILAPTGATNASPAGAFGGTSAAAPHVAGAMALLLEAFPGANPATLRQLLADRSLAAAPTIDASGARRLNMGSLAGLGPLLPPGAGRAQLLGALPDGPGLALVQYDGPDGYPTRFAHLLADGHRVIALYTLDVREQRWRAYVVGAPAFVNREFTEFEDGLLLVLSLR